MKLSDQSRRLIKELEAIQKEEKSNTTNPTSDPDYKEKEIFPLYPVYPPSDDIYNKFKKEEDLDPEVTSENKENNRESGKRNESDFFEDKTGNDLDVPGSELDDEQEDIGSEDEENNYYSIGGDDHSNLDESDPDRQ
jgi:hypothetical protein